MYRFLDGRSRSVIDSPFSRTISESATLPFRRPATRSRLSVEWIALMLHSISDLVVLLIGGLPSTRLGPWD